jgi:hypothetical protein
VDTTCQRFDWAETTRSVGGGMVYTLPSLATLVLIKRESRPIRLQELLQRCCLLQQTPGTPEPYVEAAETAVFE